MTRICARETCTNPVPRGPRGRPPIYCSPACRPTLARAALVVELVQDDSDDSEPGRDWIVRLRRGAHTVPVRRELGHFTAEAVATELRHFLRGVGPIQREEGGGIE